MKKTLFVAIAVLLLAAQGLSAQKAPASLTAMSYNIRNGQSSDGTNSWQHRYPASAMMVQDQMPDILCIQEALADQVRYLDDVFREYSYVGVGKEDGKKKGEHCAIFYKSKVYTVVKSGAFWLSETPDKPSACWDSGETSCATWAIFKEKKGGGHRFLVVNVQLCADDSDARGKSASLIADRIAELNRESLPVLLLGDFRTAADAPELTALRSMLKDARQTAAASDTSHSYHAWGKKKETVDHIWYNGFSSCVEFSTVTSPYYERTFISTHFPVKAKLIF